MVHNTIPSHIGVAVSNSHDKLHRPTIDSYTYLKSIFLGQRSAGVNASTFTDSLPVSQDLLGYHALQCSASMTFCDDRNKLLQHIVHGKCFAFSRNCHASSQFARVGCHSVAVNEATPLGIPKTVAIVIEESSANNISTQDLIILVESIGVHGPYHNPKDL